MYHKSCIALGERHIHVKWSQVLTPGPNCSQLLWVCGNIICTKFENLSWKGNLNKIRGRKFSFILSNLMLLSQRPYRFMKEDPTEPVAVRKMSDSFLVYQQQCVRLQPCLIGTIHFLKKYSYRFTNRNLKWRNWLVVTYSQIPLPSQSLDLRLIFLIPDLTALFMGYFNSTFKSLSSNLIILFNSILLSSA